MKIIIKGHQIKINKRIFTFLLIIIQSCGIRFFEGQGSLLIFVIIYLSRKGFEYIKPKDIRILVSSFAFLFFIKLLNNDSFIFSKLIFQYGILVEAYIFLASYRKNGVFRLKEDFYEVLNLIFIHSLLAYFLYILIPTAFIQTNAFGYTYKTLFYLFYVTGDSVGRNNGILWEPGLLQLMLNVFLFISINKNKHPIVLVLCVLAIISTISTTGFICLFLNYLFYILKNYNTNKRSVLLLIVISLFLSGGLFFIWNNISDKIGGENTSGLVRYRDFMIGIELIKESPIFGHGLFDNAYLLSKGYVNSIESSIFSNEYISISGELGGGYTNGLLGIFCWYGIPMGFLILSGFYKNYFVAGKKYKRILFFLIIAFTLISEPITYTSFFLILILSPVIFSHKQIIKFKPLRSSDRIPPNRLIN